MSHHNSPSMRNTFFKAAGLFAVAALSLPLLFTACQPSTTKSGLKAADFQVEIDGKQNDLYVLTNKNGMEVCMTNYGARIVSIMVPDKDGVYADVVLGFDSIGGYLNNKTDFGAFIGRYGNRINQGRFTLDGVDYQLETNNFGHSLHGGPKGFQYRMFDVKQIDKQTLEVSYVSADGEMGFPGTLTSKAVYTLTDDNAIDIKYEATTDKPTIINLTNHSYFNLTGNPENDVMGHVLAIAADYYTPVDPTFMTTGEIAPVCGTPMDFRKPTLIGARIDQYSFDQLKNGNGYDHNWVFCPERADSLPVCFVFDTLSGRTMEVYTNEPGVQVYSGNFLDGTVTGKKGIVYKQRVGLCLETQHYPDSPNKADWPSVVLRPGETYKSHCVYKFGVMTDDCLKACKEKKCCKDSTDCSKCDEGCCKDKATPCNKSKEASSCCKEAAAKK